MRLLLNNKKRFLVIFLILCLAGTTRFIKLDWGNGFFFHPDENNMAWAVERMSLESLNPEFFAYGQLPLFLTFFSYQIVHLGNKFAPVPFSQAILLLRFWSAVFSVAAIVVGYLLAKFLFKKEKHALIFALLLVFTPGLIQAAHFGTTESILTFIALSLAYLSLRIFERGLRGKNIFLVSLIGGMGLATKVNAFLFLLPVFLVFFFCYRKEKSKKKWLAKGLLMMVLMALFFFLFSPFHFINWQEALSTTKYESAVAMGKTSIFYTRQFVNTKPIFFQAIKIFPWTLGLPIFIILLVGFVTFVSGIVKKIVKLNFSKFKIQPSWIIFHSAWLPWFLFNSFLFVKWVRFMVPILPFLVLGAVWFIKILEEKYWHKRFSSDLICFYLFLSFIAVSCVPGLIFLKIYLFSDIRLEASEWMNENLSHESLVLSEGGNIVNLPIGRKGELRIINFDFYNLDQEREKQTELKNWIREADYILLPSRRVFAGYVNRGGLKEGLPETVGFYQALFSGELGFRPLKEFKVFSDWEEMVVGSDLTSGETWTVFDHPTIRVFSRF